MEIPIELLVVFVVVIILFMLSVWFRLTRRRARKKYNKHNPDNEKYKTRRGGEERGTSEVRGGETTVPAKTDSSVPGPTEPAERTILPTADPDVSGEDRRRLGNPLVRRTRRRK